MICLHRTKLIPGKDHLTLELWLDEAYIFAVNEKANGGSEVMVNTATEVYEYQVNEAPPEVAELMRRAEADYEEA